MTQNNKRKVKRKINYGNVIFWVMIYLGFLFMGFVLGMVYQQAIVKQGIIDVLSYTDIEVGINFNETKFIEELNRTIRTIIPALKETFNETQGGARACTGGSFTNPC